MGDRRIDRVTDRQIMILRLRSNGMYCKTRPDTWLPQSRAGGQ